MGANRGIHTSPTTLLALALVVDCLCTDGGNCVYVLGSRRVDQVCVKRGLLYSAAPFVRTGDPRGRARVSVFMN